MSRYFTYRSLDDLRAGVGARGVDITLADRVDRLLQPVAIGGRTIGNRLAVHPMEGCDGTLDGRPGELTFRRWQRFGSGGAKLIWGEATAVVPEGRANPRQLLVNDDTAPDFERLLRETRAVHQERFERDDDLLIGLQLTHSGRWSYPQPLIARHSRTLDPLKHIGADGPLLDDAHLERLAQAYAAAARLARDAGFDFVDVKQCHTYLLNELLAARHRDGPYGGSFENRTRLLRDVITAIRREAGDGLLLASRVNVYDGPRYGGPPGQRGEPDPEPDNTGFGVSGVDGISPDMAEPLRLVGLLRDLGVRLVNVTMGSPYFNPHIGRPFERAPVDGYEPPEHPLEGVARHFRLAGEVQRAYPDIAVIGTGYSWLRHYAALAGEANVALGRVTLMGLGRGALAYPDFAADLVERGQMSDRKACIGVSYCTALMRAKGNELGQFPAGCVPRDPLYAEQFKLATGRAV
ncbi:MAG TPA: NADH:flavin oxidoreductase [Dehalococcoidia bacterium]|jgi:2,4-dienoyl-CoA reductase-like NADH-dependent reductase (Old Yellow Enzyme family)|nr:NADH:flavin oxidoreductase [Dehalococcoidia bacterium]